MQITRNELKQRESQIGVDRIVIHDFKVLKLPPKSYVEKQKYIEEFVRLEENEVFKFDWTYRLYSNGETKDYQKLHFNPTKVLHKHNVFNARPNDIRESLKILKTVLKQNDIEIDFTHSKINEIEINQNILVDFNEYFEVFKILFIRQKYNENRRSGKETTNLNDVYKDKSISSLLATTKVQIYNKTEEVNNPELLKTQLTRIEWRFQHSAYYYWCKKFELDNSLNTLLENFWLIEELFLKRTKNNLFKKGFHYLQKKFKPEMEKKYLEFKNSNKLAKQTGRKQQRDVYKYLEKETGIFDYLYLIEIVNKHNKKNSGREIKRILKKYKRFDNLEKLHYFFSSLFSNNEEKLYSHFMSSIQAKTKLNR